MRGRRRLAVCALCLLLLSGCGGRSDAVPGLPGASGTPSGTASGSARPSPSPSPTPLSGGPVAPPSHGATLGAWVKPASLDDPGRLTAVAALQNRVGRTLDIVHTYRRWTEPFGTTSDIAFQQAGSTMMFSWAGVDTRRTAAGDEDDVIREHAHQIKGLGHPVFLRWRWEMDRPNLRGQMHSGADYIAAWKHIRQVFQQEKVTNVSWVWCPTAGGFGPDRDAATFYPGDDQVDWVCADAYPGKQPRSFADTAQPFLTWAATHPHKPVMLGEWGVPRSYGANRPQWLKDAVAFIRTQPQVRASCYYDSDPDRDPPVEGYAVDDDPPTLAIFTKMARSQYFNPNKRPLHPVPSPLAVPLPTG